MEYKIFQISDNAVNPSNTGYINFNTELENNDHYVCSIEPIANEGYMFWEYTINTTDNLDIYTAVLKGSIDLTLKFSYDDDDRDDAQTCIVYLDGVKYKTFSKDTTLDIPQDASKVKVVWSGKSKYYKYGDMIVTENIRYLTLPFTLPAILPYPEKDHVTYKSNAYEFTPLDDLIIEAEYKRYYIVRAVNKTSSEAPNAYIDGIGEYFKNTVCVLTAYANRSGRKFNYWINPNGSQITDNPITFIVDKDLIYNAYFNKMAYKITITSEPNIGTVYLSQDTAYIDDVVTIKAREYQGYKFSHWSDDTTENPKTLTGIDADLNLIAYYDTLEVNKIASKWRAYIKSRMNLSAKPITWLTWDSGDIATDLLSSASANLKFTNVPKDEIAEGDVITVTDPYGAKWYEGVIKTIDSDNKTITTRQIQHLFSGTWKHDLPSYLGSGSDKSWAVNIYESQGLDDYIYATDVDSLTPTSTKTIADSSVSLDMNLGTKYTAKFTSFVYSDKRQKLDVKFLADVKGTLSINNNRIGGVTFDSDEDAIDNGAATEQIVFKKGWNKILVVYTRDTDEDTTDDGKDGFILQVDGKNLASCGYFSNMTSTSSSEVESLEQTFAESLKEYCKGNMLDSSYTDPVIGKSLGIFNIVTTSDTKGHFESQSDGYTMDMEQMIYDLYDKYKIMVTVDIPYEGTPTIYIGTSQIVERLKVSDNNNSITNLSPVTEIEETNKVIIYDSDGIYRTTYVNEHGGSQVEQPSDLTNRYDVVNTSIVQSDDNISDILKANLPDEMYNHKLTFDLNLFTSLYTNKDFILGMPLKVWKDTDYYSTILTGMEFSKESNKNVNVISYTCGTVRTTLTKKLLKKFGVIS